MNPFWRIAQRGQCRCVRMLCSFPAAQLRRREVAMAALLHNVPRRIISHFWDLVMLPLGAAYGPWGVLLDLPARDRPVTDTRNGVAVEYSSTRTLPFVMISLLPVGRLRGDRVQLQGGHVESWERRGRSAQRSSL